MIELFTFCLIILYGISIEFEARWDAEAFKEGQSNHLFKIGFLLSFLVMCVLFSRIGKEILSGLDMDKFIYINGLLLFDYVCVRIWLFDDRLNKLRGNEGDYKTLSTWVKNMFLIIAIIVIPLAIHYIS